nr:uncharacterized protein LOC109156702 [Ipomoea trifida]
MAQRRGSKETCVAKRTRVGESGQKFESDVNNGIIAGGFGGRGKAPCGGGGCGGIVVAALAGTGFDNCDSSASIPNHRQLC